MKGRTLHPLLQRLLALILLGVALGAAVSSIAMPVVEALNERDSATVRLARYQRALTGPSAVIRVQNPDDLAALRLDEADAQLALQAAIDRAEAGKHPGAGHRHSLTDQLARLAGLLRQARAPVYCTQPHQIRLRLLSESARLCASSNHGP